MLCFHAQLCSGHATRYYMHCQSIYICQKMPTQFQLLLTSDIEDPIFASNTYDEAAAPEAKLTFNWRKEEPILMSVDIVQVCRIMQRYHSTSLTSASTSTIVPEGAVPTCRSLKRGYWLQKANWQMTKKKFSEGQLFLFVMFTKHRQSLFILDGSKKAKKNTEERESFWTSRAPVEELIENLSICSSSTSSRWKSSRFSNKFVALNCIMCTDLLAPAQVPHRQA